MSSEPTTQTEYCEVCGTVDGRVDHVVEDIDLVGVRMEQAEQYALNHSDWEDVSQIPWETLQEAITHVQQLKNRELGIGYLAELEEGQD